MSKNKLLIQNGVIGLIQGLWLYWAFELWSNQEPWVPLLAGGIAFLLTAGISAQIFRAPDKKAWIKILVFGGIIGLLAAWVFSFSENTSGIFGDLVRRRSFVIGGIILFFLSLPVLRQTSEPTNYFSRLWQGVYWIAIAFVFTGLCWAFLSVWAGLFRMLGVEWFHELFFSELFAWVVSPIILSMGFYLQVNRDAAAKSLQKITCHFLNILNPFICVLVIIFAAALVLKHLDILFTGVEISSAYVGLLLFLYVAINALAGKETDSSANILWITKAALLLSPLVIVLLMVEQWQQVASEGMMPGSYWNLAFLLWLLGIGLAYIFHSACHWIKRTNSFDDPDRTNQGLVYFTLLLFLLLHTPPFDALKVSAESQKERLLNDTVARLTVSDLSCDLGHYGHRALADLAKHAEDSKVKTSAQKALEADACLGEGPNIQWGSLKTIPDTLEIPPTLKSHLEGRHAYHLDDCHLSREHACVLARVELPGYLTAYILVDDDSETVSNFYLLSPSAEGFESHLYYPKGQAKTEQLLQMLQAGSIEWVRPQHYDMELGGIRYQRAE